MRDYSDLTGRQFHGLRVIGKADGKKWHCECSCGNICTATRLDLKSGHKKSCGCRQKKHNVIYSVNGVCICLMRSGYFWFDECDLDFVQSHHWNESNEGYAVTYDNGKTKRFTRLLFGLHDSNVVVDHINGDVHDNRRCNLRLCNTAGNNRHRAGTKGYSITKHGKYAARIYVNNKRIHLGNYDTEAEAVAAYNAAAKIYFGDFTTYSKGEPYYP